MSREGKWIGRTGPILMLVIATATATGSGTVHAESVEPVLKATMRAMAAAVSEIEKFAKTPDRRPTPVESARKVVVLAKSIPGIFPPGSELAELPVKFDAPPTTWDEYERFLDAQKHLVVEVSKLFAAVNGGDREAIARQVATTRRACAACHEKFRN